MSGHIPVCLALYIAAAGHYRCQTLYRATLEHLGRQIPLTTFAARVAHIKARPSEVAIAEVIAADLRASGFRVEIAVADWSRGSSHMAEYLKDQIKVSQWEEVNDCPFVWQTDDDGLLVCYKDPLEQVVARSTQWLTASPEHLTARFLRREDLPAIPAIQSAPSEGDMMFTHHVNWNAPLLRSRDYHRMLKVIEDNWTAAVQMHGEALWREVLAPFARGYHKHMVWHPDAVDCVHIGVPAYADICAAHRLTVAPNPS